MRISESIWAVSTSQILGSATGGPFSAVTASGEGIVEGDKPEEMELWGAPGIVFRPRPPENVQGSDGKTYEVGCEAKTVQAGDRVMPFSWRDLRLNKAFPAPKPGTTALVGYGGGFLSFDDVDTPSGKASMLTAYVPYEFDSSGVPTKALAIIADPSQESVALIQGDGAAVVLGPSGITARADGSTWLSLGPGSCSIVAAAIQLRGVVSMGASAEAPALMAAGLAIAGGGTPTVCPSVYLSGV